MGLLNDLHALAEKRVMRLIDFALRELLEDLDFALPATAVTEHRLVVDRDSVQVELLAGGLILLLILVKWVTSLAVRTLHLISLLVDQFVLSDESSGLIPTDHVHVLSHLDELGVP